MIEFRKVFSILFGIVLLVSCSKPEVDDETKYSGVLFTDNIRTTEARTPEEELAGFKIPEGFEIQLFASEPDIQKPVNISFDAKGRMWVTQSFDYPLPAPGKATDRISILEDTNGDGKADKFTHFNDTLDIPVGVYPMNDGAISFSIPYVYKFTDANGDGKADGSNNMFGPFGYSDTHGMVSNFIRGYDGWIHACHGFTNLSVIAGADGDSIRMISGNTFRFKIDGSRVEQTTFGQVNPFGLAYDENGYIYSTDSHSSPLYQLINGGDYPHFGKVEIMAFGPDMKSLDKEATALCGIAYYADTKFPVEHQRNLYIGDALYSRVHRYSYVNNGSTPIGKAEVDLVKSEDPWFRPVNVKLGPDGAIYIADFYNSVIGHYEVPLGHPKRDKSRGRIWRITYKGQHHDRKDLSAANIDELLAALDHDNLPNRLAATDQLTDRIGAKAVEPVTTMLAKKETTARQYVHGLWVLQRLQAMAPDLIQRSASHSNELIRLHTMRILAEEKPDHEKVYPIVSAGLKDKDPHVQRAAVELLLKYPSMNAVESVLAVLHNTPVSDTHLTYTARLCLRNLLRQEAVIKQVVAKPWTPEEIVFIEGTLVDVYSPEAGIFLAKNVKQNPLPKEKMPLAYQQIARFVPEKDVDGVISNVKESYASDIDLAASVFKGIRQGIAQRGGKESAVLQQWGASIAEGILKKYPSGSGSEEHVIIPQREGADLAGDFKVKSLVPALSAFLKRKSVDHVDVKTSALTALLKILPDQGAAMAGSLLLSDSTPLDFKKRIAAAMDKVPGPAVNNVLAQVKNAPPDLQSAVAVTLASSAEGKKILFDKIRKGELQARILVDPRVEERMMLNMTPGEQKEFDNFTANLAEVNKERDALIEARLASFGTFKSSTIQVDSGQQIFNRYCNACHKRIDVPSIGPQLTGMGAKGAAALAEKIIDPNRNISEAFRNYTIRMKNGKVLSGIFRREEGAVLVFADLSGKEFMVPKKDIAEKKISRFTIMPDSFGETISEKEFNLLLAYLLNS